MARRLKSVLDDSADEAEDKKRKVGFLISSENDFKLTVYARKKRLDRSKIIDECLTNLLSGVTVSFRGKSSEMGEVA